jgi:aerobic C4-dicarboxylate transport protein
MNINPAAFNPRDIADYTAGTAQYGAANFFTNILPSSIAGAFVTGNTLQIVFSQRSFRAGAGTVPRARPPAPRPHGLCLRWPMAPLQELAARW